MEHEVNVPFSVGSVRAALAEPERVARCVPGLQLDAPEGETGVSGAAGASGGGTPGAGGRTEGRLRVRIGGSTITYRGSLTVTSQGEGFTVDGTGTEARGSGSVRLDLSVVPRRSREGEGTRLVCSGTVRGEGRIKDMEQKTVNAAGLRLLDRFGAALGESIRDRPPETLDAPDAPATEPSTDPAATGQTAAEGAGGIGEPGDNERVIPGIPGPGLETGDPRGAADQAAPADGADAAGPGPDRTDSTADRPGPPERAGVFETEVPPPSLDPAGDEDEADIDEAEAAHARRTMIGRSAEEVDHAPPRGRYAPVPVAEPLADSAALRWAAPAAAVVVAGAVVIGRALRRRR